MSTIFVHRDWAVIKKAIDDYKAGGDIGEICRRADLKSSTFYRRLHALKVPLRGHPDKRKGPSHYYKKMGDYSAAHPIVRTLLDEAARKRVTLQDIERKTGVSRSTIHNWAGRSIPNLVNVEAVATYLGFTLELVADVSYQTTIDRQSDDDRRQETNAQEREASTKGEAAKAAPT